MCTLIKLLFSHCICIADDDRSVPAVAAERRRVPAGAQRDPPLPREAQPPEAPPLPQRREAADLQVRKGKALQHFQLISGAFC